MFLFMLHFEMALLDKQVCAPSGTKGSSPWQLSTYNRVEIFISRPLSALCDLHPGEKA